MNVSKGLIAAAAIFCVSCAIVAKSDAPALDAVLTGFDNDEHGDLHSVMVIRKGMVQAERYYDGGDNQTLVDVRSAAKSVTSLLMGIALDQGAVATLDDPVEKYWLEAKGSAVGAVRLADLLTMRAGLAADDDAPDLPGNEDFMDEAADPRSFTLQVPGAEAPGVRYRYNSLAAYVAGIVIERATGEGLEDFARRTLFAPLGIDHLDWQEDASGQTKGQGNLFLEARDFARIGEMVLGGGLYDGRRIISSHWIEESLKPRVDISASDPFASGYGYYWYHQTYPAGGHSVAVFFASGNGGNKIYVIPELEMVVSVMSRAYGQGRGQRRSEAILKAILATASSR